MVGSVDFGSAVRQRIREGASGKGAGQCPRRQKEKGLCLTVPFRAGSQRLSFLSLGPVFQSSCYLLENKPLLSISALGDILYPNCGTSPVLSWVCCSMLDYILYPYCGTSPVLWVCCSMLDYVCGDQKI